jgi:hypothetical protein
MKLSCIISYDKTAEFQVCCFVVVGGRVKDDRKQNTLVLLHKGHGQLDMTSHLCTFVEL